jgi:Ca2+-binding EF-hand superfamily protein
MSKKDSQKTKTLDRITPVEKALRGKFGQKFDSVKKAFLFMDADHDGYITIEDFLRNFSDIEVSYDDLSKLMRERDSQHVGKLNY